MIGLLKRRSTVAVVDGPHLYFASRLYGLDIDYTRLRGWLDDNTDLIRSVYHGVLLPPGSRDPVVRLARFLLLNGYVVEIKQSRHVAHPGRGVPRTAATSIIGEMTTSLLEAAEYAQQVVLFSGSGDMVPGVRSAMRRGVHVVVVSTVRASDATPPEPMVAEALREAADDFIDLFDLRDAIKDTRCATTRRAMPAGDDDGEAG